MTRSPARPLVMRCGAFGDIVLLTPLLRQLAARFGTPVDLVSMGPWTVPLLTGQPGVGELLMLVSRRRPYLLSPDQWRLVRALQARGPGPTWFLDPRGVGRGLLRRAGIGDEWIVDADAFPIVPGEHNIERWWRVADATPPALREVPPAPARALDGVALEVTDSARRDADAWLAGLGVAGQPLLLVQAGNGRTMRRADRTRASNIKYWPEQRWRPVLEAMRARCPGYAILLLGAPVEHALNEDILRHAPTGIAINAAQSLPIPRLLAVLERAAGMVTIDTGPAHAAAALGVPQVVLFGAADPAYYRPWGATRPPTLCLKGDPGTHLLSVTAERVVAAWRELPLREAGPAR